MKLVMFACFCAAATAFYTDVDESINPETMKNSDEIHKYVDCYLDKAPCTDSMLSYKKHINEAIENVCAMCSPSQKHITEEFIKVMSVKYPNELEEIKNKYDPEGSHFARVLAELAKY